ncbi:MAG: hypothetical protein ACFFBP_19820 [Promethearchaeota archaeon]
MENDFLKISSVFSSLDIIEKGIEKIYFYLLKNKKIENLKEVSAEFGLTLKRGYKICSVLSELELVQIYDRPMKVLLTTPIVPVWQKIVNKKIEELQAAFQEKRRICENALEDFLNSYELVEEEVQEPVEFINFDIGQISQIHYPFLADNKSKIAIGIKYNNPLVNLIHDTMDKKEKLTEDLIQRFNSSIEKIKPNLQKIDVQVIFNSELVETLVKSKEFEAISKLLESTYLTFKNFQVRVSDENFSNFCLMAENELVQPSFSPTHDLIGIYISRNQNIFQIFDDKFNELFSTAIALNEYVEMHPELGMTSISEIQAFTLCLI